MSPIDKRYNIYFLNIFSGCCVLILPLVMGQQAKFNFFENPPIGGSMSIVEPPNLVTPSWNFVTPISKSTKVSLNNMVGLFATLN